MNTNPPSYNEIYNEIYSHKCNLQLKEETLQFLINKYNIKTALSQMLYMLKEFNIVLLCDDSGSMNTRNTYTKENGVSTTTTRWEEAKEFILNILDFAMALDDDGIDLFFLNRPPIFNVNNKEEVINTFQNIASGSTPLVKTLEKIYQKYKNTDKNILLLTITDGLPDESESEFKDVLKNMLKHQMPKFRISLMLATDDENTVDLYNRIDSEFDFFDVSDDYLSEYNEIIKIQGTNFKFSMGDYICKFLLSSICNDLDKLDEKKIDINKIVKYFTETYDKYGLAKTETYKSKKSRMNGLKKCTIL